MVRQTRIEAPLRSAAMSKNFEIRRRVVLEAGPEQVGRAIAAPEAQAACWPDPYQTLEGMELEGAETERVAVHTPEAENGDFQAFDSLVGADDEGTTALTFVHSGYLVDDGEAE